MPAYDYLCRDCNRAFTVFLSLSEFETKPRIRCPHCESDNVARQFGAFFAKTGKKS